jgi:hypothetical protein
MTPIERTARAICAACGDPPDSTGDCRGNDKRWQDYIEPAKAAIGALADGGVLVRLERIEEYEDCHPELLAEDAFRIRRGSVWPYEVIG